MAQVQFPPSNDARVSLDRFTTTLFGETTLNTEGFTLAAFGVMALMAVVVLKLKG